MSTVGDASSIGDKHGKIDADAARKDIKDGSANKEDRKDVSDGKKGRRRRRSPREPKETGSLTGNSLLRRILPGGVTVAGIVALLSQQKTAIGSLSKVLPELRKVVAHAAGINPWLTGFAIALGIALFLVVALLIISHEWRVAAKVDKAGQLVTWKPALTRVCLQGDEKNRAPHGKRSIFSLTEFEEQLRKVLDRDRTGSSSRLGRYLNPGASDKLVRDAAAVAVLNFKDWLWIQECNDNPNLGFDFYYQTLRRVDREPTKEDALTV